jgi:uncharacterized protein (DUF1778 family)
VISGYSKSKVEEYKTWGDPYRLGPYGSSKDFTFRLQGRKPYAIVMHMRQEPTSSGTTQVLSVRVSASERELLALAAEQGRTNLSDFVRRKAVEAAEVAVLGNPVVTIPSADWEKFEAWVKEPAKDVPALRELAAHRPAWQD